MSPARPHLPPEPPWYEWGQLPPVAEPVDAGDFAPPDPDTLQPDEEPTPSRRRPPRWVVAAAALVVFALLGAAVGAAWASSGSSSAVAAPETGFVAPVPSTPRPTTPRSPSTTTPTTPSTPSNPATPTPSTPAPSQGSGLDEDAIAARVDPAVVNISTTLANGSAAGTGMVLTASGIVLTNNHVIAESTSIKAQINGAGKTYDATVLGYDVTDDVAVLQLVGASNLATISPGDSSKVVAGDPVVALGNALGRGGTPAVVTGRVTATGVTITVDDPSGTPQRLDDLIQVTAPLQPGDSGGPLVNSSGDVIGMDTAAGASSGRNSAAGEGYAIPINDALEIAHQIQDQRGSDVVHIGPRGVMGVQVSDQASVGSAGGGVGVVAVDPSGPAAAAGMAAGDTITAVDGTKVGAVAGLQSLLDAHHPDDSVHVTWTKANGGTGGADIKLVEGPPA